MPEWTPALADSAAVQQAREYLNHDQRRRMQREDRRRSKRMRTRPLGLGDIPDGSVLSRRIEEAISGGQYILRREIPPNTRPSRKERQRQSRRDRILNQPAERRS